MEKETSIQKCEICHQIGRFNLVTRVCESCKKVDASLPLLNFDLKKISKLNVVELFFLCVCGFCFWKAIFDKEMQPEYFLLALCSGLFVLGLLVLENYLSN